MMQLCSLAVCILGYPKGEKWNFDADGPIVCLRFAVTPESQVEQPVFVLDLQAFDNGADGDLDGPSC